MNHPDDPFDVEQFGAAYWEERYGNGEGTSKHEPSPSLVTETGGLRPGRALDAGCGHGSDALWLAARGWHVTAVDISATALERGRQSAQAAGPGVPERITWIHGDLTEWEPDERSFDLVTSHYVHVPGAPEPLFRRLASWVSPGGMLLVVAHDAGTGDDHQHGHGHAHPPEATVQAGQIVNVLSADEWSIIFAGSRTHTMRQPDGGGPVTLHDVVLHARRRPDPATADRL